MRFFSTRSIRAMMRDRFRLVDVRGFRLLSVLFLENFRFFYRLNAWLGKTFPFLSVEVNCEAEKKPASEG